MGFFGEARKEVGEDRSSSSVEFDQSLEKLIGHFFEEGRGGRAACDLMLAELVENVGDVGEAGFGEVGIGNHAGDSVREIGKEKDREGDEIDLAGLEVEAGAEGFVLSEEEAVTSDNAFRGAGAAAGKGDEGGGIGWEINGRAGGGFGIPAVGKGEFWTGRESVRELAIFEPKELGFRAPDEGLWGKPIEALFDEVGTFCGINEDDDESGVETTQEDLVQFDGDWMKDEDVIAYFETLFSEEIGSALDAGVEFSEGDGSIAVDDRNTISFLGVKFFDEIHSFFAKRA